MAPPGAAAAPPYYDWDAPRRRVDLDFHTRRRRLKRAKRGSSPGPTGWRADHLHLLLSARPVLARFHQALRFVQCTLRIR